MIVFYVSVVHRVLDAVEMRLEVRIDALPARRIVVVDLLPPRVYRIDRAIARLRRQLETILVNFVCTQRESAREVAPVLLGVLRIPEGRLDQDFRGAKARETSDNLGDLHLPFRRKRAIGINAVVHVVPRYQMRDADD